MARILATLERHPLFEGVPRDDLTPLVLACRLRTPVRGDRLFSAGDDATGFFVVASGRIKLFRNTPGGREHVVEVFRAGDSFALMPVLDDGNYPVNAEALTDAALVWIPRTAYKRLLRRRPELNDRATKEIAEKMRHLNTRLEEVATRSVPSRIALHLLRLARNGAGSVNAGVVVDLGGNRETVAASLGTVREVLIRNLRSLEDAGVLSLRGKRVEICKPDRLRELAES
ncbi:MAG: Crp/Fnr family transcriptional regulator [Planctomycetota bacterium]|jgi:CRP/FNR family transcriptional regulator